MSKKFLFIILISLSILGCSYRDKIYVEKPNKLINENLKPGDPEKKIIAFMVSQGWIYHYDQYNMRFSGSDTKVKEPKFRLFKTGYGIYIYVDKTKSFVRGEAYVAVTAP
jgi:hypothetical protein